jgi:hypothetical protein
VTVERSIARDTAEGMAPRPGADHARDDCIGSANAGSALSNADRGIATSRGGGSRARTGVPVRPSSTAETGCSGFRSLEALVLRLDASPDERNEQAGASLRGNTSRVHLRCKHEPAQANGVFGESGGVTSPPREVRDGRAPRKRVTRSTPKGVRRSNRHRWKASRVMEVCVRVTATQREVA